MKLKVGALIFFVVASLLACCGISSAPYISRTTLVQKANQPTELQKSRPHTHKADYGVLLVSYSSAPKSSVEGKRNFDSKSIQSVASHLRKTNPDVPIALMTDDKNTTAGLDNDLDYVIYIQSRHILPGDNSRGDNVYRQWITRLFYFAQSPFLLTLYVDTTISVCTRELGKMLADEVATDSFDLALNFQNYRTPSGLHNWCVMFRLNIQTRALLKYWLWEQIEVSWFADDQGTLRRAIGKVPDLRFAKLRDSFANAFTRDKIIPNLSRNTDGPISLWHSGQGRGHEEWCQFINSYTSSRMVAGRPGKPNSLLRNFTACVTFFNLTKKDESKCSGVPEKPRESSSPVLLCLWDVKANQCAATTARGVPLPVPVPVALPVPVPVPVSVPAPAPAPVPVPCQVVYVGGNPDNNNYGGWSLCDHYMSQPHNLISLGSGCDSTFEWGFLKSSPGSQAHVFDPTIDRARFESCANSNYKRFGFTPANDSLHFWPLGMSDTARTVQFYKSQNPKIGSLSEVALKKYDKSTTEGVLLPLSTLMTMTGTHRASLPTVLKIDIEGSEFSTILSWCSDSKSFGFAARMIQQIAVEYHDRLCATGQCNRSATTSCLNQLGFKLQDTSKSSEKNLYVNTQVFQ